MNRVAALSEVLAHNPNDAFARYGLGMAHLSDGSVDAALNEFATLLQNNPDYVPAYQMAAQTLVKHNQSARGIDVLKQGIAAAKRTGNAHAESEMQALLDEVGDSNY